MYHSIAPDVRRFGALDLSAPLNYPRRRPFYGLGETMAPPIVTFGAPDPARQGKNQKDDCRYAAEDDRKNRDTGKSRLFGCLRESRGGWFVGCGRIWTRSCKDLRGRDLVVLSSRIGSPRFRHTIVQVESMERDICRPSIWGGRRSSIDLENISGEQVHLAMYFACVFEYSASFGAMRSLKRQDTCDNWVTHCPCQQCNWTRLLYLYLYRRGGWCISGRGRSYSHILLGQSWAHGVGSGSSLSSMETALNSTVSGLLASMSDRAKHIKAWLHAPGSPPCADSVASVLPNYRALDLFLHVHISILPLSVPATALMVLPLPLRVSFIPHR
ncbi:hypothetical protein BDU57DRAFT_360356 [Ampelomyces quisqualis]|uniref:Uncharacterized protein n=1 Tax=Ampelomyces quisqualis TaxID=50730 RepID=A0A6A5QDN2_AMPQU|nr:hypothetical protein BDU57DRAFT_360356 [Ampelomyces quisqualis]